MALGRNLFGIVKGRRITARESHFTLVREDSSVKVKSRLGRSEPGGWVSTKSS